MTMKTAFAALGVVLCGIARGEVLNARSYVQEGLVACYDGIENAGVGQHDSSSRVWVDISGNGNDGTVSDRIAWTATGWSYADTSTLNPSVQPVVLTPGVSEVINARRFTVECVSKPTYVNKSGLGNRFSYFSSYYGASGKQRGFALEAAENHRFRVYEQKAHNAFSVSPDLQGDNVFSTFSAVMDGADLTGYVNGLQVLKEAQTGTPALNADPPVIGGEDQTTRDITFRGEYYGCRVYNRTLTADELMLNSAVDRIRFANAVPAEQTLPDGYRITADRDLQVRVKVAETAGGSVKLNGQESASWLYLSRGSALTLVATPDAGHEFVRWMGIDVGGARVTRPEMQMTVPRGPVEVTAVFRPQGAGVSSGDYVRHGLLVRFDGHDNAGTGSHSDSPSVWADLSGHGNDGVLGAGLVWKADGWSNDEDGHPVTLGFTVGQALADKRTFTVDFACRPARQRVRGCFFSQYGGSGVKGALSVEHNSSGHRKCGGLRLYQQGQSTASVDEYSENAYSLAEEEVTLAVAVSPTEGRMFKNGLFCDAFADLAMLAIPPSSSFVVGGEPSRPSMAFRGTYHAFRLYARVLTESELMINAAVDSLRYRRLSLEDVRLPEGAAFDAQTNIVLQVEVAVSGRGNVSVDSGERMRSYRATHRLNDEVKLAALPVTDDRPFVCWRGDVDLIQEGSADTSSIVVSAARPFRLTAVFKRLEGDPGEGLNVVICNNRKDFEP